MKRTLALALLTCLAAPAWADPPIPEWVRAASRCTNLTPNCNPFADMMSDADLAVFRYLTVYSIFDLPPKELCDWRSIKSKKQSRQHVPVARPPARMPTE